MDARHSKRNSRRWREKIKRFSDAGKNIVAIPPIIEIVEVELPLAGIAVEHKHIAVAIRVLPDHYCAKNHQCHCPSNIRMGLYLIWDIKVLQFFAPSSFVFRKF